MQRERDFTDRHNKACLNKRNQKIVSYTALQNDRRIITECFWQAHGLST